MKNFKVEVSKGLEKYNLIRKAENEALLKEELHKEGFGILSVQVMDDIEVSGNKFFFEIVEKDGSLKSGTIVSNDIFKAYLKIKDQLKYNLKYIYPQKDSPLDEKEKIIHELEEQYRIYLESNKKDLEKKQTLENEKIKVVQEEKIDNFQMKKELDEVYKIIDKVLFKLKNFLELNDEKFLPYEKKEKLREIYSLIIKLKSSTNIPKLRQVGEIALTKMGEIELQVLESKKDEASQKLLLETNKLLKEVGSRTTFIQKEKDIGYIIGNFFKELKQSYDDTKTKKTKFSIDTTSSSYLKTKLLLEKYEKKLKELDKEILKNFIIYILPTEKNNEQKINYELRKKVIKQNIFILKSRLTGKIFSYTKIIKGYNSFVGKIVGLFEFFEKPILIFMFIYAFLFSVLNALTFLNIIDIKTNFSGLFYFIYICLGYILFRYVKGLLSLSFNIVILSFLFIFGVINF